MAAPITQDFLDSVSTVTLPDAASIDAYFATLSPGATFISWFNANRDVAAWGNKTIPATASCANQFTLFWDNASQVFGAPPNLVQFLCLMSIMVNEVGGILLPVEERVNGPSGNPPGIAYAFNAIPGLKISYNTMAGNHTAFQLFSDPTYIAAHGAKPLAADFLPPNTIDPAWQGTTWPAGVPTSSDPAQTGFLLEADFFKFRGRGLIQTTGRANYAKLVAYVQAYAGTDPAVLALGTKWAGQLADTIATTSSNDDWHSLFFGQTLDVARQAIVIHNASSGNYLDLASTDAATLNGTGLGSVYRMGLKISGGSAYAATFQARVATLCATIAASQAIA